MSNVTISHPNTGESLTLWQAQDTELTVTGSVQTKSIYYDDSESVYVYSLEIDEDVDVSGLVGVGRLPYESDYDSDPNVALAQFAQRLMTIVNGHQGIGWDVDMPERGQTYRGKVSSVGWQINRGERHQLQWDLSLKRGEGIEGAEASTASPANPSQSWSLDGNDLGVMESLRENKQTKMDTTTKALADDASENIVVEEQGAIREVTISGIIPDESRRNTFDEAMRTIMTEDKTVKYESAFPGHTLDVMVKDYSASREAGRTREGIYDMTLVEGQK